MKSFFKKVALLLVLAMVVTMLPAKTASAADAEGPQMYSTLRLYVGGDATETYSESAYAKTWNKGGYDVVGGFSSSNEEVATVNDRGLVTAEGVGTATITAVFTSTTGGESVTKTCKVTVKRNALEAGLGEGTAEKLQNLVVGQKLQTKVYRSYADADGVVQQVWKGKDVVTDAVRYSSSDENVFKVTKRGGYVTAVGVGTAILKVWPVQTEKAEYNEDGTVKEYKATAEAKEYTVVVLDPMEVKQSAWNKFEITFPTEDDAKLAVDNTKPTVNKADAPVSEAEEVIKVDLQLKDSNDNLLAKYIRNVEQKADAPNVVVVTMFEELEQESVYQIRYLKETRTVTTVKNVADGIELYRAEGDNLGSNQSYTIVGARVYVIHPEDGHKVYIGDTENKGIAGTTNNCKAYTTWSSYVKVTDLNTQVYHPDYSFDDVSWRIDFYTDDDNLGVKLQAVFEDWNNLDEKKMPKPLSDVKEFTPGDNKIVIGDIISWGIESPDYNGLPDDGGWSANYEDTFENSYKEPATKDGWKKVAEGGNHKLAAEDNGFILAVKANIRIGSRSEIVYVGLDREGNLANTANMPGGNSTYDKFTFRSSNDDKLIISEENGVLYPSKESSGIVNVYVYYDGSFIGSCPIEIINKREFTHFSVDTANGSEAAKSNVKMSFNASTGIDEQIKLTLKAQDQLMAPYNEDMTYTAEIIVSNDAKGCVEFVADTVDDAQKAQNNTGVFWVKATSQLAPGKVITFNVLCTATYNDGRREIVKKSSVTLSAKHTRVMDEKTFNLITDKRDNTVGIGFNDLETTMEDKKVTIKAYSYDNAGFTVQKVPLSASGSVPDSNSGAANYTVVLQYGSTAQKVINDRFWSDGNNVYFNPTYVDADKASDTYVVSGSAERLQRIRNYATGTYTVRLYVKDGTSVKPTYKAGLQLSVVDNQAKPSWTWINYSTPVSSAQEAIEKCLKFDYWPVRFIGDQLYDMSFNEADYLDTEVRADRLTIRKVIYAFKGADGYAIVFEVPVMRSVMYQVIE